MYTDFINTVISRINNIKTFEVISSYTPALTMFAEFVTTDLQSLSPRILYAYSIFFNDLSISNGEGLNLLKGNSFCQTIGDEYTYPAVRKIMLDNISSFTNGEYIEKKFDQTIKDLLTYVQNLQTEYTTYTPSDQPSSGNKTKIELFWEEKGIANLTNFFSSLKNILSTLISSINSISTTIETWLTYGLTISFNIAMAQNVFSFMKINVGDEKTLFDYFNLEKNNINIYSPSSCEFLNVINTVLAQYPDEKNIPEKIKIALLIHLDVKNTSLGLYQTVLSNFNYLFGDQ